MYSLLNGKGSVANIVCKCEVNRASGFLVICKMDDSGSNGSGLSVFIIPALQMAMSCNHKRIKEMMTDTNIHHATTFDIYFYSNWEEGEPSGTNQCGEYTRRAQWNNPSCGNSKSFMCRRRQGIKLPLTSYANDPQFQHSISTQFNLIL